MTEDDTREIETHFKNVLGRELPADGKEHFMNLLRKGTTLKQIKESISGSPEALYLKTRKYIKDYPKFVSKFSRKEIERKIQTIKDPYHMIIVNNTYNKNSRTTAEYQMWAAQAIPSDLTGKSILDIGTADGFYSFLCENRGAKRVVALDIIQFDGFKVWKEILDSKVEFKIMTIQQLSNLDEVFDYVICFGVYYHLANPVEAIEKIAQKTKDSAFLAGHIIDNEEPIMCYYDEYEMHPEDRSNWWVATPSCLNQIAKRVGFTSAELISKMAFNNSFQPDMVKKGIRAVKNVGTFKFSK